MNCLHPVRIVDPKCLGRKILVPCGHCACCLKRRADSWTDRIRVEASQHKYQFFATLTYSDEFVPIFRPENVLDYEYFTDKQREDTYNYLCEHDASEQYLVLRYSDFQKFFKRFRDYIYHDKNIPKEQKNVRYVCVGEYGETTYRPHFHIILFSDCDYLCTAQVRRYRDGRSLPLRSPIERYFRKAWQVENKIESGKGVHRSSIGRVDFQVVRDNAARYVSSYVSSYSFIPSFLRCSAFKPFISASKFPVIGSWKMDVAKAKEIIINGLPRFVNEFGNENDRNRIVYLWRSLKDRLFPKLPNYANLDKFCRKLLYGLVVETGFSDFKDFRDWLVDSSLNAPSFDLPVHYKEQVIDDICKALKCDYDFLCKYGIETDSPICNSLVRLWRVSALFAHNCSVYDFKVDDYVNRIDCFYQHFNYDGLCSQLEFSALYCKTHSPKDLVSFIDPLVFENNSIESSRKILSSFGFTDDDDFADYQYYDRPENRVCLEKDVVFVEVGKSYKRKSDYIIHKGLSNVNCI